MAAFALRMRLCAAGAAQTIVGSQDRIGRYMGTGKLSGIRIRQKFERMFITICPINANAHTVGHVELRHESGT
jgi:hypothetical protein